MVKQFYHSNYSLVEFILNNYDYYFVTCVCITEGEDEEDDVDDSDGEGRGDDDDELSLRLRGPDPAIDTSRVEEIPAKEPKFHAVPLKSALKKPPTPTQESPLGTPVSGGPLK